MDIDDFDEVLNLNDPDFAAKFMAALGVKPGDTLELATPQFARTDGLTPALSIDDWSALRNCSRATLKAMGCQAWDEPDERGKVLMLFPHEWYKLIPSGYEIIDINGERELFQRGVTDDDMRYGTLAFGLEVDGQ